jgi:hypothetical protein
MPSKAMKHLLLLPALLLTASTQLFANPIYLSPKACLTDTIALPDSVLIRYTGDYFIEDVHVTVGFVLQNHQLVIHTQDGRYIPLSAQTQTQFIVFGKEGASVEFKDLVNGKAQTAAMAEGGESKVAKRQAVTPTAFHNSTDTLLLPDSVLNRYVGAYQVENTEDTVGFTNEDHQLVARTKNGRSWRLTAENQFKFVVEDRGASVEFSDIVEGKAQSAALTDKGDTKHAKRKS